VVEYAKLRPIVVCEIKDFVTKAIFEFTVFNEY